MNKLFKSIAVVIASAALIFSATAFAPVNTSACVTSATSGSCGPYTYSGITTSNGFNTYVVNDMWNPISGSSQTLTSNSPGNWSVSANMPKDNKAVISYPDTQQLYTTTGNMPQALSNFHLIRSTFKDSGVANLGDYEWAYDIWEGSGTQNYSQEIMIWTDNQNQIPAGTNIKTITVDNVQFQLWVSTNDSIVTFVRTTGEKSGAVRVLSLLDYLVANHYSPAGSGLNMIDYGIEICSTNSVAKTFGLSGYTIQTK